MRLPRILAFSVVWGRLRAHTGSGAGAAGPPQIEQASANGFVPLQPPSNAPTGKVLVVAPLNCPSAEAQRADALVQGLASDGIPCEKIADASFSFDHKPRPAEAERLDSIMKGRLPIVFVNGRARNDPELADIEAEYRGSGSR